MNIEVSRRFNIPRNELWQWVTDPEKTELWYGPWTYDKEPGVVNVTLVMEDGLPTVQGKILGIDLLNSYSLQFGLFDGAWVVNVVTEPDGEAEDRSVFKIKHSLSGSDEELKAVIAGWEFYADCLKAAIEHLEIPVFSDYYQFPEG